MIGETISDILISKDSEQIVIKTICNYYKLNLGGYNILKEINEAEYISHNQPHWLKKTIKKIITDNYILYILNENGDGFSYGFDIINGNGDTSLILDFHIQKEFSEILHQNVDDTFYEI